MSNIGHNVGGIAGDRLRSFVERIERLEEELKALNSDKSEVYKESRGAGFDPKIIKAVVRLRKMDVADRREQEELVEVYLRAIDGVLPDENVSVQAHVHAHEGPEENQQVGGPDTEGEGEAGDVDHSPSDSEAIPGAAPPEDGVEDEPDPETETGPEPVDEPPQPPSDEDDLTDIPDFLRRAG